MKLSSFNVTQVLLYITSSLGEAGHFFFSRLRLTKFPVWSLRVFAWFIIIFASVFMLVF